MRTVTMTECSILLCCLTSLYSTVYTQFIDSHQLTSETLTVLIIVMRTACSYTNRWQGLYGCSNHYYLQVLKETSALLKCQLSQP